MCWVQDGELSIADASVRHPPPGDRLWVLDGSVTVGGEAFDNILPLPFDRSGLVQVTLAGAEGSFAASGSRVTLIVSGSPRSIEDTRV